MIYEWSQEKNKLNQQKHGISFEEAKEVFTGAISPEMATHTNKQ